MCQKIAVAPEKELHSSIDKEYFAIIGYVVFSLIHCLSLTRHHQKATRTGMRTHPPVTTPAATPG